MLTNHVFQARKSRTITQEFQSKRQYADHFVFFSNNPRFFLRVLELPFLSCSQLKKMFWRFGFNNPSAIDGLLEQEDVTLEEILCDQDIIQEAKSQNPKLIEL